MNDTIEVNYEIMQQVASKFEQLHDKASEMHQSLTTSWQALQSSWTGEGFDKFQDEAEEITGPSVKRLIEAFDQAATMTKQISQIFQESDEECSSSFSIQ